MICSRSASQSGVEEVSVPCRKCGSRASGHNKYLLHWHQEHTTNEQCKHTLNLRGEDQGPTENEAETMVELIRVEHVTVASDINERDSLWM